jgi:Mce-associated membrane protein
VPSWLPRTLAALLAVLLAAILAASLLLVDGRERLAQAATPWRTEPRPSAELSAEHREVAAAAQEMALAFLTVDHRDMEPVVDAVLDRATGAFAEQYAAQRERLVAEAERTRAVATPQVVASGVAEVGGGEATVLVAADSVVRNAGSDEPRPRYYRLRLELVRVDGRWLTRSVEFVR